MEVEVGGESQGRPSGVLRRSRGKDLQVGVGKVSLGEERGFRDF